MPATVRHWILAIDILVRFAIREGTAHLVRFEPARFAAMTEGTGVGAIRPDVRRLEAAPNELARRSIT